MSLKSFINESKYVAAKIKRCSEGKCNIKLDNISENIILKGEKLCNDKKINDCMVIVFEENMICLVELKSRIAHVNNVFEKLHNGTLVILDLLKEAKVNIKDYDFIHIVLHKRIHSIDSKIIKSKKIKIFKNSYDVISKSCGISLKLILDSYN